LIVMDIGMPRLNGLDARRQITQSAPQAKVLMLTAHRSEKLVSEAVDAGARGYMLKADTVPCLIKGAVALRRNRIFFSPRVAAMARALRVKKSGRTGILMANDLTPRQREILQLLAEGKSNRQIGLALELSVKTVETHRIHIMSRLDCHSISGLVRYAIRNHILEALIRGPWRQSGWSGRSPHCCRPPRWPRNSRYSRPEPHCRHNRLS
jgi:DNA-binding NarL/FixJ family response regulator